MHRPPRPAHPDRTGRPETGLHSGHQQHPANARPPQPAQGKATKAPVGNGGAKNRTRENGETPNPATAAHTPASAPGRRDTATRTWDAAPAPARRTGTAHRTPARPTTYVSHHKKRISKTETHC
ncbi:hypothetical protein GCM10027570_05650 [Streptomonospora sediminis]